mgnify:FL=1
MKIEKYKLWEKEYMNCEENWVEVVIVGSNKGEKDLWI